MKPILTLLLSFMLFICNQCFYSKNNERSDSIGEYKSLVGVDSVAVVYWAIDSYEYIFSYSNGNLKINRSSNDAPFHKDIFNSHIIEDFLDFIDIFFITKSEAIELSRVKGNPIVTDYPDITVKLYFENQLVHKQSIQYGEEGYDIEYNPKFVAFYDLLDSLVSFSYVYRYRTDIIDEEPRFGKGGIEAFAKWVQSRVNYVNPEKEVSGGVVLQFVVNTDGSVSDIVILRSLDPEFDKEAIRVISSSPKWRPGKNKGEAINVSFVLPVSFQIR